MNFIASTEGNLPDLVKQSGYSIEGSNLIIDKGLKGVGLEDKYLKEQIIKECITLEENAIIEISTIQKEPNAIDLQKTTDEIEKITKLPILASVPVYGISKNKTDKTNINELIMHKDPKSPISEVFRTLRTNIQFINSKKKTKVILITSTVPGEGKSWISANIATAFAQSRKNCNAN